MRDICLRTSSLSNNIYNYILTHKRTLKICVYMGFVCYLIHGNSDLFNNSECLLEMPPEVSKIFREPEYCDFCHNITSIDKMENISPEDFHLKYAITGKPLIITDGMRDWRAQKIFTFDFFKNLYETVYDGSTTRSCQFFPYKTEFKNLREVFAMSKSRAHLDPDEKPWYVGWSNCIDQTGKPLRQFYSKPYFLGNYSENIALSWIFMGGPGNGAQMHVDNVLYPSWQAQLNGKKLWKLAPPPECYNTCPNLEVVVEPGEISVDGLCILLRRFAYPNRLVDLESIFGYSYKGLSSIINTVMMVICNNNSHLLENLGNVPWLNEAKLRAYSEAIMEKGAPMNNCWGFIDGTIRPICRPTENQEEYYSGYKKVHCVKYQSVLCPDGIVISLKGAYPGHRHDAGMLRELGLYEELVQYTVFGNQNYFLYGDKGYGLRELLLRPYTELQVVGHPERQIFNTVMSSLRIAVEWGFQKIVQEFAFVDFKKNQKLLLQEIGTMYITCMILTNCHTCLYGSQTGTYFNIEPPQLEEYLVVIDTNRWYHQTSVLLGDLSITIGSEFD